MRWAVTRLAAGRAEVADDEALQAPCERSGTDAERDDGDGDVTSCHAASLRGNRHSGSARRGALGIGARERWSLWRLPYGIIALMYGARQAAICWLPSAVICPLSPYDVPGLVLSPGNTAASTMVAPVTPARISALVALIQDV